MARKKVDLSLCPMCDEMYDPNGPRAAIHEHPEPQSGPPREALIKSGLPYEAWIVQTTEGRQWHRRIGYVDPVCRACGEIVCIRDGQEHTGWWGLGARE